VFHLKHYVFLPFSACLALAACDGDSHPGSREPDAGTGGNGNPDSSIITKDGGGGGGTAGSDGGETPPPDHTPPTFNGIKTIEALNEAAVRVDWDPAVDNVTASGAMGYRVYRASAKGKEDFTRKRRCGSFLPDASTVTQAESACYVTAVAGATNAVLGDVLPAQDFFYVARAVDAAGNEDTNTNEASYKTSDATPPIFGGVDSLTAVNATTVQVTWGTAFDTTAPDPTLVYEVYLSAGEVPDPDKDKPAYTSKPGEHSTTITKLDPLTTYHTIVRATDPSGNTEDNTYSLSVTTPEGVAPTFDGLKRASGDGNTVRLFWLPASDNVTHPENIVYDVYSSLVQHREDFTKPPRATSAPGAASIAIPEVNAATRYFYVVRARDVAGNRDINNVEKGAQTGPLPDQTPPTFNGVQAAVAAGPSSLTLSWNTPSDETSQFPGDFTYYVYTSTSSTVATKTPALTVRGNTSATLVGLAPGTNYWVVVIAKDAAGNPSNVSAPVQGTTAAAIPGDVTPPNFVGTPAVTPNIPIPSQLDVTWTAATDDASAASDIRYHVCISTVKTDCSGTAFASHIAATTDYGILKAKISYLDTRTTYFVYVRAEDRSGNLETKDHLIPATTATSWVTNAKPILFNHCVSCHDYDMASVMVGVGSSYVQVPGEDPSCTTVPKDFSACPLQLVDPGRPQFSLVYRRINPLGLTTPPFTSTAKNLYSGVREPRDTVEKLSAEEDSILLDWITQGAFSN
jgi:hypothetical protein